MTGNANRPTKSLTKHGRCRAGSEPLAAPGMACLEGHERGDVPGWVMITLMSAILVAGLLALATPALQDLFTQAMDRVGQ